MHFSKIDVNLLNSYDNQKLIVFLVDNFRKSAPVKLNDMRMCLLNSEADKAKKILHELKNLFGNIGAAESAKKCQGYFDNVTQYFSESEAQAVYEDLLSEFDLVLVELDHLRKST